jgi:mannonate dehydratase
MRLALVTRPLTDDKLHLAAQIGVTDIVADCPGPDPAGFDALHARISAVGLRLSVIENCLPLIRPVLGQPGRDEDIEEIANIIRNMGRLQVPVLCYNFMPSGDWNRTSVTMPERGGALVSAFDEAEIEAVASLLANGTIRDNEAAEHERVPAAQLWENLEYFLERLLPVAEQEGVALAMHPDDPPMSSFRGYEQIMTSPDAFDRLLGLSSSPANGICYCQGSFGSMGIDVVANIRRFADAIKYVHFRDVRGSVPKFQETFHDNGPTDMAAAIRTYVELGFDGPIRPDHVPVLHGESTDWAGYTMLGRLHAIGYMQGLIEAARAAT